MKKYDLYLFDFDGTLLDTLPSLDYVFKTSYESIGVSWDSSLTEEFSRIPLHVGYEKLGAKKEHWEVFCKTIDESLDHQKTIELSKCYPETKEFVKYLKDHNLKAGIVTSNNKKHVIEVLKVLGIDPNIFEVIIGNKECQRFKPYPDPILIGLEAFNYKGDKRKVVYVGDGNNDMLSAISAGVDAVLIDRENNAPLNKDYKIIHKLTDLFE